MKDFAISAKVWLWIFILVVLASGIAAAQDDTRPVLDGEVVVTAGVADTLDSIAAFYDVKVECLGEINEIEDIHRILVGQEIIVSDSCPRYGGFDVVTHPRPDASPAFGLQSAPSSDGQGGGGESIWVVGIADTLDTIGQELNVSVLAIALANEIELGAPLRVGQELIIPADAPAYGEFPVLIEAPNAGQGGGSGPEGEFYVVQPGDVLDAIAQGFDVSVPCVAEANELANVGQITPGLQLFIPSDCPVYGTPAAS